MARMEVPGRRKKFKSFDKKDTRMFSAAENLHYISSEKDFTIYRTKNFSPSILEMAEFKNFEAMFLKKFKGYSIVFDILTGLPFSLPSLQVQICKSGKKVYNGIIVTFSGNSNDSELSPLLLVSRISKKNLYPIHDVLQDIFCCDFVSITPNLLQSNWLIGIALHETLRKGRPASDLTLNFKLPISFSAECEASLTSDSLFAIWNSIPSSCEDTLDIEVVSIFLKETIEHFSKTYGINFKAAPIISVGLKDVCLSLNNQLIISVCKPEIAFSLLSFLEADCHDC